MIPCSCARFERVRDLLRDRQCFIEWDRAAGDALRQIVALDEFHHEGGHAPAFFQAVDGRDVGMIQRGEGLGFTLEASQAIRVVRKRLGEDLDRDVAVQLRIARAKHLAHPADTDAGDDFVDAETGAGFEGQTVGV